jgi:hypothetical protein
MLRLMCKSNSLYTTAGKAKAPLFLRADKRGRVQ